MLTSLSIRDIVLIDRLDLAFADGLCVLTGETGAGKSILLDALGLALGNRADQRLLRPGAAQASVTAAFDVPAGHSAFQILADQGLDAEDGGLVLRRVLGADGRSRAFVNDQPVSAALLRGLGDSLIEVQGQFEQRGLLDPARHRELLDAYGSLFGQSGSVARLWQAWRGALQALEEAERDFEKARAEEGYLRDAVAELTALDPTTGEEQRLAEQRQLLMHGEQLLAAMTQAADALTGGDGDGGAESALALAQRDLERVADKAGGRLDRALAALSRAAAETEEALAAINTLSADLEFDSGELERIEERFFALKDLARKHSVAVDDLAALSEEMTRSLEAIEDGGARRTRLQAEATAAEQAYLEAAEALSKARTKASQALDRAVNAELPPLKLDKARFQTRLERLEEPDWGPHGLDRIGFEVSTNPGAPLGPLARIASGGELSRFLLALKLVLADIGSAQSLVFDEVDSAIGGATAHAVGERLERLARDRQVLVVTHSPQVAARGRHHWRVHKETAGPAKGERLATRVGQLNPDERREELARMLSGAVVTDEARAAADRLMGAA